MLLAETKSYTKEVIIYKALTQILIMMGPFQWMICWTWYNDMKQWS